jgi:hypothetical protein
MISLAYLEEDGLLLSIGLLIATIVLTVETVAVWEIIVAAKWMIGLWQTHRAQRARVQESQ